MADGFQEMTQKLQESNSEAVKKQDEILVKSVRGHLAHRKRLQEISAQEMEAVKSAVLTKRKTAQMEEALLLQTATDMGITVDELKSQYDSITIDPANINKLIFKPFEEISKSLMEFETSFSKNLSGASGAIKELTGGVIDLGQLAQDGADKVAAVQTLILTPFKLANTAIAQTTKFFTGKEVNFGQDLADWWAGTEETIDGETKKTDGFRDKALQGIQWCWWYVEWYQRSCYQSNRFNSKDG